MSLKAAATRVAVTALIASGNGGGTKSLRKLETRLLDAGITVTRTAGDLRRYHDKFVLIDHSSNGTWVTVEGKAEITLRREEMILRGRGHVSFGHAFADDPAEVLAFASLD